MTYLEDETIEDIYYNGNFWTESSFGSTFDYQAFAKAVQRAAAPDDEKEPVVQCTC